MRLKDKVAVITGSAAGIGRSAAEIFVREGARVIVADLNRDGAESVAAALGGPLLLTSGPDLNCGNSWWRSNPSPFRQGMP